MTVIRTVARLAVVVALVAESGNFFRATAKLQEDGACPLFVLLPFTSV